MKVAKSLLQRSKKSLMKFELFSFLLVFLNEKILCDCFGPRMKIGN